MLYTAIIMFCYVKMDPVCMYPLVTANPIPHRTIEQCEQDLENAILKEGSIVLKKQCISWNLDI